MRLLNVRIDEELRVLIERAVKVSGRETLSEWARDALEAGARTELSEADRRAVPNLGIRRLGVGDRGLLQPSGCQHPPQARFVGVTSVDCLLCGKVVRRTI